MADLNKVFLMGRLTHDPELRYTSAGGTAVTDLRLATSRIWTGKDGDRKEDTLYIDVTVWNRQAETCCQYLKKGKSIHVEGFLKLENWESPTGEKRSKIKIEADRVQFLDRRDDAGGGGGGGGSDEEFTPRRTTSAPAASASSSAAPRASYPSRSAPQAPPRASTPPPPVDSDMEDDDIPF